MDYNDYPIFGVEEEYNKQMALQGERETSGIVNNRLRTFMVNNYNGIGVVLPIRCTMNGDNDDFVNKEIITVITYKADDPSKTITHKKTLTKHELYHCVDGKIHVNFNLLLTEEGETVLNMGFYTAGGRSYVRSIHITVAGDTLCRIHLYRIKSNWRLNINDDELDTRQISGTNDYKAHMVRPFNRYMFSHVRNYDERLRDIKDYKLPNGGTNWVKKEHFMEVAGFHRLYVPGVYYTGNPGQGDPDYYGIRLNYVVIINQAGLDWLRENHPDEYNDLAVFNEETDINSSSRKFDLYIRRVLIDPDGDPEDPSNIKDKYYTFISCDFDYDEQNGQYIYIKNAVREAAQAKTYGGQPIKVIRNGDGFFPQKHYLEELGVGLKYKTDEWGNQILDDNGNPIYEGLSRGARLEDYTITDRDTVVAIPEAKYNGLTIKDAEWIFINKSAVGDKREIKMISTKEPFVGKDIKKALEPGFYDVIFRYKTGDQPHEVRLNSAFLKKA